GFNCVATTDCASSVCTTNKCQAATCGDGAKNGTESDVDCGGSCLTNCGTGKLCGMAVDCASGVCSGSSVKCQAATCFDGVKNGTESDTDCGPGCTSKCADGKVCSGNADCTSKICIGNICQVPS